MELEEIKALMKVQDKNSLPFSISDVDLLNSNLVINAKVPLLVEYVANDFDRTVDILIDDESGVNLGILLFTKGKEFNIMSMTEYQFIAMLLEMEDEDPIINGSYVFNNNYVIIEYQFLTDYENKFKATAPIWGKFSHAYPGINVTSINTKITGNLTAEEFKQFNKNYYFETAVRGIGQISPFERYLKFYHLLELNFDYDVIKRIQSLNINTDALSIGKMLKEYDKTEFKRLTYFFDTYVTNHTAILSKLNNIFLYPTIAQIFLFDFGKDYNPLNYSLFQKFEADTGGFSYTNYKIFKSSKASQSDFNEFIGKFVMYIIYRVRSSIVHNKLGEFLMTENEKEFVHEFAEPLLLELIKQVFKN